MKDLCYEGFYLCEAAGLYLIYNTSNPNLIYKEPLRINESGAYIFKLLCKGMASEEIAMVLSEEFNLEKDEALADVCDFINALSKFGIHNEEIH